MDLPIPTQSTPVLQRNFQLKTFQRQEFSHISPLTPSHLLDYAHGYEEDYEEDDEGPFGVAHHPSELNIKCQEEEEDEDYPEHFYQEDILVPQDRGYRYQPRQSEMSHLPPSLIQDLQAMLADYKQRFSPQQPIPRAPSPKVLIPDPVPQSIITVPTPSLPDPFSSSTHL